MKRPQQILQDLVQELQSSQDDARRMQSAHLEQGKANEVHYEEGRIHAFSATVKRLESAIRHIDTLENKDVLIALITEIDESLESLDQDYELPEGAGYMIRHVKMLFIALQVVLQEAM